MSQTLTPPKQFYFEMFSPAGEKACNSLLAKVFRKLEGSQRVFKEDIELMLTEGMKKISDKHPEVYDTEPQANFAELVSKKAKEMGYGWEISRWEL